MQKPILYIDMDNVLVDFKSGIEQLSEEAQQQYAGRLDEVPHIFSLMKPMVGAIEAVEQLKAHYDIYVLSTAPWENPSAWSDKLNWIKTYFGDVFYKRLILSHHKNLNTGEYLIDDRTANGAGHFKGTLLQFGKEYANWQTITDYLLSEAKLYKNIEVKLAKNLELMNQIWSLHSKDEKVFIYPMGERNLSTEQSKCPEHSAFNLSTFLQEKVSCLRYEIHTQEGVVYCLINHKRYKTFRRIVNKWKKMYSQEFIEYAKDDTSFIRSLNLFSDFKKCDFIKLEKVEKCFVSYPITGRGFKYKGKIDETIQYNLKNN
ncbi:hypothetical protein NYR70_05040 [Actinobacillus equuli subsp. equuli]|uniref:5' nucleotidase, NT5C type n=1 Tax=Actinobacillus equuli TaxID=718 RepID=UPI0024420282|nr:hypothetical protein [Actinobacillus equuli]WGE56042.1 hypothetical protein NYR70_05040 [Actinobacillus equuli subsp. equuli]